MRYRSHLGDPKWIDRNRPRPNVKRGLKRPKRDPKPHRQPETTPEAARRKRERLYRTAGYQANLKIEREKVRRLAEAERSAERNLRSKEGESSDSSDSHSTEEERRRKLQHRRKLLGLDVQSFEKNWSARLEDIYQDVLRFIERERWEGRR